MSKLSRAKLIANRKNGRLGGRPPPKEPMRRCTCYFTAAFHRRVLEHVERQNLKRAKADQGEDLTISALLMDVVQRMLDGKLKVDAAA